MHRHPRNAILATLLVLAALALGACGDSHTRVTTGTYAGGSGKNAPYLNVGPLVYEVQISRELNGFSTEDAQYLEGLPKGTTAPTPDQEWFGVFLWAKNQTEEAQTTIDNFEVVDTSGDVYYPIKLNPALNPFAWTAQTLQPNGTEPGPNTIASDGPTQGGLLLFKVNDSVYSNRPLTLYILGSDNQKLGSISLDL